MAAENKPEDEHGHLKIYLPKKLLECLPKCSSLPKERHRWNTNEEIAAYLITFEKHEEWLTTSPKTRPQNGSMILYNRKKVKYRKDGYCWKKRKDGKTTREDHMKLKVQGVEVRNGGGWMGPDPTWTRQTQADTTLSSPGSSKHHAEPDPASCPPPHSPPCHLAP
nr:calmodulin-binding transcription activator 1-like [Oncorhynchus nerka]